MSMRPFYLLAALLLGAPHARAEWFADAQTAAVFDSNVNRGREGAHIRSDSALALRIAGGYALQLDDRASLDLSTHVEHEVHHHYAGLNLIALGASAALRTKLGLGAEAPWLQLAASATRLDYTDGARDGWLLALAASGGARMNERFALRGDLRFERRRSDRAEAVVPGISGAVFDIDGLTATVATDYTASRATLLSAVYSYRVGDVVSSTPRNRAVFVVSDAIARDRVFGSDSIAYRLDARSHVFELQVSHALGERASANLGFARTLTYGDGGNDYYSSRVSASLLYAF